MDFDYYKTKESVDEYINLAKDVNSAGIIEMLKMHLPKNSTLLELGTGPGTDYKLLHSFYEVTGSDNSNEFLNRLQANIPSGSFIELDAETLNTERKFDGIYANKVLHHLSDEELAASVKRQHAILNKDGIVCHTFWKGEGNESFKGMFVNYHLENEIEQFFTPQFETLVLESYKEFEAGDSVVFIGKIRQQ